MNVEKRDTKILIVEDEAIIATEMEVLLERLGYTVTQTLGSGDDVLKAVAVEEPDAILMDINLRGTIDGIDAAKKVNIFYDVPVVYVTSYTDNETLQRAKITEPFGYIVKPFSERDLHTSIEMALYKHGLDKELRESATMLETILTSIEEAIFATDINGKIAFINPVAERLIGYGNIDVTGEYIGDVIKIIDTRTNEAIVGYHLEVIDKGISLIFDTNLLFRDDKGKDTPVVFVGSPRLSKWGNVLGAVFFIRIL